MPDHMPAAAIRPELVAWWQAVMPPAGTPVPIRTNIKEN